MEKELFKILGFGRKRTFSKKIVNKKFRSFSLMGKELFLFGGKKSFFRFLWIVDRKLQFCGKNSFFLSHRAE